MVVASAQRESTAADVDSASVATVAMEPRNAADLKAEALADAAVQAMLDVFPADIRDIEEM
jgi:hypothetical protein